MNMTTENNIYSEHLAEWLKAKKDKKKRGEIVHNICFVAGVHPKSVPRSFRRIQMRRPGNAERRGRKTVFTPDVVAALKDVWDVASEPCAENLHGVLADYVRIMARDKVWKHPEQTTAKLLAMSLGAMKKRVARFVRKRFLTHGKSTTNPSSIHALIPVRSGDWETAPVGTEQIDTVAHCGHTLAGDFIYTVNATDVSTLWGARRAQLNKGQTATVASMEHMEQQLPFRWSSGIRIRGANSLTGTVMGGAKKEVYGSLAPGRIEKMTTVLSKSATGTLCGGGLAIPDLILSKLSTLLMPCMMCLRHT